jgi:Tfp pilus assembly protein PilF
MNTRPATVEQLFFVGTNLMSEGDVSGAEQVFREALQSAPDFAEVHANLGLLLDQAQRPDEAERHYRRALELSPDQTQTWLNLGALLATGKHHAEAEATYRRVLALDETFDAAWSNLGVLLACTKREAEAEQCYRTVLARTPDHRNAAFNLAYLLLRQGRYEEGWQRLEARDWSAVFEQQIGCARWRGEPLAGKSLLITPENGHGDMIQLCRYAALLKDAGAAKVSVLCQPGLKALFATLAGVDEVIALGEPLPASERDYWVPPWSLPFLFQTRLDTIPAQLPYLAARPERVEHWRMHMGDSAGRLRVGVVWRGDPRFENDAERSLPSLATLAPLADLSGIRWVSLQKGATESELAYLPDIVDIGNRVGDFADTAAVVANLDLVISVDTAVAHLTAAMGKPCWVLLPDYKTDWRWLKDRTDTPWYPGVMRLFRQDATGTWDSTVAALRAALCGELSCRPTRR